MPYLVPFIGETYSGSLMHCVYMATPFVSLTCLSRDPLVKLVERFVTVVSSQV